MLHIPFLKDFVDLAMPQSCAGCGASRVEICARCAKAMSGSPHQVDVRGIRRSEFPIAATALYEGPARNILLAAKEQSRVALMPVIARATLIASASLLVGADPATSVCLVPVPSMTRNLRSRGFNLVSQMTDLVERHLSMRFDDVRVIPILRHSRRVDDQSRLSAKQRRVNLHGAFSTVDEYLPALEGREVIILDDLVTTGSTLLEARRSLLAAGANLRGAACAMNSY